jgi:proteic killer suppression protein
MSDERLIRRKFGGFAEKICVRISELRAASSLSEISHLPPPRRHKLSSDRHDCWGVDISPNFRIVFKPQGTFDVNNLTTITELYIICIEDYH